MTSTSLTSTGLASVNVDIFVAIFFSFLTTRWILCLVFIAVKLQSRSFISSLCVEFGRKLSESEGHQVAVVVAISYDSGSIVDWMPPGVRRDCDIGVAYE